MSEWKPNKDRYPEKSLTDRWVEDEDPFGLEDGSPIPDDDPEEDTGKAKEQK